MNPTATTPTPRPVTPLGILVEKLEAIVQTAGQLEQLPPDLQNALQEAYSLAAGLDPYLERCTTPESPELAALAQRTAAEDWSKRFSDGETVRQLEQEMLSGHIEGQLLKLLVQITQAKRVLEVGMFTGYSALAMAEALPPEGYVVACEVDQYVADFAQDCFNQSPHGAKIRVKVAPALETLHALAEVGEAFDLVFIDADKKEYIDYVQVILNGNLLAENGLICVDNTLLQGQPYLPPEQQTANGSAIAQFNQFVAEDPRLKQVLLPLRDGVTLIRRK